MANKVVRGPNSGRHNCDIVPRRFVSLSQQRKKKEKAGRDKRKAECKETPTKKLLRGAPPWIQALAAVAIVGLTGSIFLVTTEQKKIADTANKILAGQSKILSQQGEIMSGQSGIMDRQAAEAGIQSKILESSEGISRAINRASVYFDVRIIKFTPPNRLIYGISLVMNNTGNVTTRGLVAGVECAESSDPPEKIEPFTHFSWERSKKTPISIGPKHRVGVVVCQIEEPEASKIISRSLNKFVIGEVRYSDAITPNVPQVTRIVRQIFIGDNTDISAHAVGLNNCADDDCL